MEDVFGYSRRSLRDSGAVTRYGAGRVSKKRLAFRPY
jgi:hypothetical protein